MTTHQAWPNLTLETQQIWERKAAFWADYMGEGNQFYDKLVCPAADELLAIQPQDRVLEIACGNGNYTRRMAAQGAEVVATDFSPTFIEKAQGYQHPHPERIHYQVVDATDEAQLLALGPQTFNASVCNMALMDMATIEPLFKAMAHLLKPGGCFVYTIPHPCFRSDKTTRVIEEEDVDGEMVMRYYFKNAHYLTPVAFKGMGIRGEPEPHYYFHRPLEMLLGVGFQAGFALDGLQEKVFAEDATTQNPLSWAHFKEFPLVLAVRMRFVA